MHPDMTMGAIEDLSLRSLAHANHLPALPQLPGRDRDRRHGGDPLSLLRDQLALQTKRLESGKPEERTEVKRTLAHWQHDPDLAGVRDKALEKLPAEERAAWQKLCADVNATIERIGKMK